MLEEERVWEGGGLEEERVWEGVGRYVSQSNLK